jgi:REP element-mobilizing transposase RayT
MQYKLHYKRKLPHYQPKQGVFFITFRLAFDIPQRYLSALNDFRAKLNNEAENSESENKVLIKKKLIAFLDDAYNDCHSELSLTADPRIANMIDDKIQSLCGTMYTLYAYTIMPNHVHLVIKPNCDGDYTVNLADVLKQIKGATARGINLMLNRTGSVWCHEYYDYWVRSQEEFIRIIEYIRQNPVKAKLVEKPEDWEFTFVSPDLLSEE